MATILNSGTVVFTPQGGAQTSLVSNTTATGLIVSYDLSASHTAAPSTFVTGDTILYTVVMRNTGTGTYTDPTVTVDLGGGSVSYVAESAGALLDTGTDATALTVTAVPGESGLTFTFGTATLPAGGVIYLTYNAVVTDDTSETITSTATVTAVEGSGTATTDTATATAVIVRTPLTVVKAAPGTAAVGDTLTYTFTLTNTGTAEIAVEGLTDELPANFAFDTLTMTVNGTPVPLEEGTDYTVNAEGVLSLAPAAGLSLPVDGVAIVTITGTVVA